MKDLFKKKSQAAPKKPLFGKKTDQSTGEAKAAKPSLFAKKSTKAKQPKTTNKKAPNLDINKLLMILGVLLVMIAAGLAAKLFLFNEDSVAPEVVDVGSQVASQSEIAPDVASDEMMPQPAESEPAADQAQLPADTLEPAPTQATEHTPEQAPMQEMTAPADVGIATNTTLTHDEFIQEAEKRVYRERSTNPTTSDGQ